MFSTRRPGAFTLIELVVAMCLVIMILGLALPSLSGQTRLRRLQGSFDRFDAFVAEAQQRSAHDGKPYAIVWGRNKVRLLPAEAFDDQGRPAGAVATFTTAPGEEYILQRSSSLTAEPAARWTFWPTGNCEPVNIRYKSAVGSWTAAFNPLSGRGLVQQMTVF